MCSDLSLHKAVFNRDLKSVEQILKECKGKEVNCVDNRDIHGNTALHIAVMKGLKAMVDLLLQNEANPAVQNENNWISLNEAISYGDIDIIKAVNNAFNQKIVSFLRREHLLKIFSQINKDFVMSFDCEVKDLDPTEPLKPPQVKVILTKKGMKMKVDINLKKCFHSTPEVFHVILDLSEESDTLFTITVGHQLPYYQNISNTQWQHILNDIFSGDTDNREVFEFLKKENISTKIVRNSIHSERPLFRKSVTKTVAKYKTNVFVSQDMSLISKIRTEHMRPSDNLNVENLVSLSSPPNSTVSWNEYINAPIGQFPCLGRQVIEKVETNSISVVVGLTDQLSLDYSWIAEMAKQLESHRLAALVTQIINELPKGLPVLLDLPIKPLVYLKWKLNSLEMDSNVNDSVFTIPEGFEQMEIFRFERANASNTPNVSNGSNDTNASIGSIGSNGTN